MKKCRWFLSAAKAGLAQPENIWNFNLEDSFQQVILDKAYLIWNIESYSHISVVWLKLCFILCLTAILLFNAINNFTEYTSLIFWPDSETWDPSHLIMLGVTSDVDPFNLSADYPAVYLQIIKQDIQKFVLGLLISDTVAEL